MTKCAFRLETKMIKEPDFPYPRMSMTTPGAVADLARSIEDSDIEKFVVLFLNTKNKLIGIQITPGTINRQVIYPREIIKQAILSCASAIVLVHNHPSGDPSPSFEDRHLTKTLMEACKIVNIPILDHVIIGNNGEYLSMVETNQMPVVVPEGELNLTRGTT
jgi:DNA repair protein RadC